MGSDYCFDMGYERPAAVLDALDLSGEDRTAILGGTARRLLSLPETKLA